MWSNDWPSGLLLMLGDNIMRGRTGGVSQPGYPRLVCTFIFGVGVLYRSSFARSIRATIVDEKKLVLFSSMDFYLFI